MLKNENIVSYYGSCLRTVGKLSRKEKREEEEEGEGDTLEVVLLMEFCELGSIRDVIEKLERPLSEKVSPQTKHKLKSETSISLFLT